MATKSISQLDTATTLDNGDLFETAIPDVGSASGYASKKMTLAQLADYAANNVVYPDFDTSAKSITGAVNQTIANFAAEYDSAETYAVGDVVLYSGNLYKCETAVDTPGAFDPNKWTQTNIIEILQSGGSANNYSTTEHVIGEWIDGAVLYERTFDFTSADMQGTWSINDGFGTLFYLPYGDEISKIWIDTGNSFVYSSTDGAISQTITYPVVLGGASNSYARACLQRNPSVNNGKMVINFQTTFPSNVYANKDNLTYVFTFRYTKSS